MVSPMQHATTVYQDNAAVYRICAEANADPRTVRKYLGGKNITAEAAERIRKAIASLESTREL